MENNRRAGVLMPISALGGFGGIGTFGKQCYRFIDCLEKGGQSVWQILPLLPTGYGNSPYQCPSAVALNYYFIDVCELAQMGLLTVDEVVSYSDGEGDFVNYGALFDNKIRLLKRAFSRFNIDDNNFCAFKRRGRYNDFALFMALKEKFDFKPWNEWSEPYRTYSEEVTERFKSGSQNYEFWLFTQYICLNQWTKVKQYANSKGIEIMGDIPLYLSYDSVEVWKEGNNLFKVDAYKNMTAVAGAPPDSFSEDGQVWGNPLYDWQKMREDGYKWWNERISNSFELYDILRLDHFRGFDRYFCIPFGANSAREGWWEEGPSFDFFKDKLNLKIVAEDLGVLDDGVYALMANTAYPGMRLMTFAFDNRAQNEHKPCNISYNCVAYTTSHDNQPLLGYVKEAISDVAFMLDLKSQCDRYNIAFDSSSIKDICRAIISLAYASEAKLCIIPVWDALFLGDEARINNPGIQTKDNWSWRIKDEGAYARLVPFLKELCQKYNR